MIESSNNVYIKPNFANLLNNNLTDNNVILSKEKSGSGKYIITVIEDDKIRDICLNEFGKSIIRFGRSEDNDIVISSLLVSSHHGYFELKDGNINIYDDNSKNGLYINNMKNLVSTLKDGDAIKIDNPLEPLNRGVLMIVTIGDNLNKWLQFNLDNKQSVTIGRGDSCDIVLNRISISLQHAKITKNKDGYYLSGFGSSSGIILNGSILRGQVLLKDRDLIIINNVKLIYNKNHILYQMYDNGVRLDAIDIVKTVKVKGKKRDISQHVDFSAQPGEFIAFVGGSGAGKTTFMKCISGINKPTSGKVLLNGNDLFSNYSALKNLIGYVPQEDIVIKDLTLIDMLNYAANLRMPDDATYVEKSNRINDVLDIVELSNKKDVMIKNLSGGQRKRASIAVELLADPKLFFLDEPTSGLDPGTERSIMLTLRKMADSGKTIILVTHNTLNLHLCDKVVFFGVGGKLCFDGKPLDALSFFGVNDFVDIYTLLNNDTDKWYNLFSQSNYRSKIVDTSNGDSNINYKKNSKSFFKQFVTLTRRQIKALLNNRQQLLLLFAQAPLIAYLLSLIVTNEIFYSYEETKSILFSISTSAVWLGLLNSIQEVCKERVILEKEYMADLKLSSYLISKVVYLSLLALIQSFLLITSFRLFVDVPSDGIIWGWYPESIFIIFLTIMSASSIGLVVSSLSKDSSVAMTYAPLLLVPQLLFSGMLFPLDGLVDIISNFILCRFSVEALGTTNDLNSLVSAIQEVIPGYVREAENYYTFTVSHFFNDVSIIVLMSIILLVISYIILNRQLESGR